MEPFIKPKIIIDEDVQKQLKEVTDVEAQVIVHCSFYASSPLDRFRIWPTTYLIDRESGQKSRLLHAENVPFSPYWKIAETVGKHQFTLVFERLNRSCSSFDLVEVIAEAGAFEVRDIMRNQTDVYNVDL